MLRTARLVLVALLVVTVATLVPAGAAGAQSAEARLIYLAFPGHHPVWLLPVRVLVTEGVSPYRDVLDILCREPGDETVVGSVLPRGSRVERLSVAEGTATIDLKLGRPEPRGRAAELAVQAIAHTLGQFPEIKRVLVRVDGHPWPHPGSSGGQASEFPPAGGGPASVDPGAGGGAALGGGAGAAGVVEPDTGVLFSGFSDLGDDPRGGPVLGLALRGVFTGYPDGSFRPAHPVSRAEALKSLLEALTPRELPLGAAGKDSAWFSDVPRGHWVLPYLREAIWKGILPEPRPDREFGPAAPLDGVTLVDWLYRATGTADEGEQTGGTAGGVAPTPAEAEAWLVSRGILGRREGAWVECREISRLEWAEVLAGVLRLGGPDLYLAGPVAQQSLEGDVVVAGAVRWPNGTVTLGVLDSRGRELAARQARLSVLKDEVGWGWFAEWLVFRRPLTPSAGVVRVVHQPTEGEDVTGLTVHVPVFIR